MRTTLFLKAHKLISLDKVKLDVETDKALYFKVTSQYDPDKVHEVRLEYRDSALKHSCTCEHMTLSDPTNLCAHKLACMAKLVETAGAIGTEVV